MSSTVDQDPAPSSWEERKATGISICVVLTSRVKEVDSDRPGGTWKQLLVRAMIDSEEER